MYYDFTSLALGWLYNDKWNDYEEYKLKDNTNSIKIIMYTRYMLYLPQGNLSGITMIKRAEGACSVCLAGDKPHRLCMQFRLLQFIMKSHYETILIFY